MKIESEDIEVVDLFRIPERNLARLYEQIGKLQKKAHKHGLEGLELLEEGHEDIPLIDLGPEPLDWKLNNSKPWNPIVERKEPKANDRIVGYRRYHFLRLIGKAPTISGWKLVAVIEHGDTDLGNVIRVAPDMTCPVHYRQAGPLCQHCNCIRRRLETFVLVKENEYRQIGRNCLSDYLRDPEAAARLCSFAETLESIRGLCGGAEDEDFFGGGYRSKPRVGTLALLAMTARIIRFCGWCSVSMARDKQERGENAVATAHLIRSIFFDPTFFRRKDRESPFSLQLKAAARDVQDEDGQLAQTVLDWVRSHRGADNLSDYQYNLLVVLSEETVQDRHVGIACSAISSYLRFIGAQEEKKRKESLPPSVHFGELKARIRLPALFTGYHVFSQDDYRGGEQPRYLYRFLVDGHKRAIWWTTKEVDLNEGQEVVLVATIKKHSDYRGTPQTELTRCDVYQLADQGNCPHCHGLVLRCDMGKNCPGCKKRGVKVGPEWLNGGQHVEESVGSTG